MAVGSTRYAGISHLNAGRNTVGVCVAQEDEDALAASAAGARPRTLDGSATVPNSQIRGAELQSQRRDSTDDS